MRGLGRDTRSFRPFSASICRCNGREQTGTCWLGGRVVSYGGRWHWLFCPWQRGRSLGSLISWREGGGRADSRLSCACRSVSAADTLLRRERLNVTDSWCRARSVRKLQEHRRVRRATGVSAVGSFRQIARAGSLGRSGRSRRRSPSHSWDEAYELAEELAVGWVHLCWLKEPLGCP